MIKEFHVKLFTVFISVITPFVMISSGEILGSISQYWGTVYQPLFIISNIMCSYFFFSLKEWKIPSLCLILLTGFNHYQFNTFHNIFAVCFYLACLHSLFKNKRFIIYRFLFISSILFYPYSIILGEIISIIILCSYHFRVILFKEKLMGMKSSTLPRT